MLSLNPERVVICRSTPVDPDPRVERTAEALAGAGFRVTVVGWDRGWGLPSDEDRGSYRVARLRIPAPFGRGLRNLPTMARWQVALFGRLRRLRNDYEIIHACDLDTALPALAAGRAFGKRLVFDIFDSYADAFRLGPLRRVARYLEAQVAAKADAVIIADDVRRSQLAGIRPRRLEVVYNSPPDQLPELTSRPDRPMVRFTLAYVGLLDRTRGLLTLLDVLATRPDWGLELAGFGIDEDLIRERARRLPNVRFHGRVNYELVLRLMAGADVLVATYDPAVPNHRYASPNKLFEAMMLAKPIIVAAETHIDDLVRRHDCGLVVPYGQARALAEALERLAADPDLRDRMGLAGRRAYEAYYRWDLMRDRLIALYRELADSR